MKETYTIPESERENVLKILARYQKKAMAYGTSLTVGAGEPYATKAERREERIDYATGTFDRSKVGEQMIEVFDLSIEGEIIRNGNYSVVAKIEHLDGGNVVATFSDEVNPAWTKLKPHWRPLQREPRPANHVHCARRGWNRKAGRSYLLEGLLAASTLRASALRSSCLI